MIKPLPLAFAFAAALSLSSLHGQDKPALPLAPAPKPAKPALPAQAPDVAAPKVGPDGQPQANFLNSHLKFVAVAKEGKSELLFLGDSITAGWNASGKKEIWEKAFGAYHPANFGIGGDRTQHVLWRIENGELDGIHPKVAVLMIGTNNVGSDPAEGTARGVTKIVETLRSKLPKTKVLILGIFPRGETPNPAREKNKQVNTIIAKLADNQHIFFLDFGTKFLQPDGTISKEIMPDFLHLTAQGYQIWADAITPKLKELMN